MDRQIFKLVLVRSNNFDIVLTLVTSPRFLKLVWSWFSPVRSFNIFRAGPFRTVLVHGPWIPGTHKKHRKVIMDFNEVVPNYSNLDQKI